MDQTADTRPYSPGLAGVLAGETTIALVDGEAGRLLYRGYPIGELVREGTYAQVAELLWTGEWPAERPSALPPAVRPGPRDALRNLPSIDASHGRPSDRRLGLGRGTASRPGRRPWSRRAS